jgi:hypothetical protein
MGLLPGCEGKPTLSSTIAKTHEKSWTVFCYYSLITRIWEENPKISSGVPMGKTQVFLRLLGYGTGTQLSSVFISTQWIILKVGEKGNDDMREKS